MIQEYYNRKVKCTFKFDKDLYKIDKENDCLVLGRRVKEKGQEVVIKKTIPLRDVGQIKNERDKDKLANFIRNPLTGY